MEELVAEFCLDECDGFRCMFAVRAPAARRDFDIADLSARAHNISMRTQPKPQGRRPTPVPITLPLPTGPLLGLQGR